MTGTEKGRPSNGKQRRRQLNLSYNGSGTDKYEVRKPLKEVRGTRQGASRRDKVYPERRMVDRPNEEGEVIDAQKKQRRNKKNCLRVTTTRNDEEKVYMSTPNTDVSTPGTSAEVRGSGDLRSPGAKKSPIARADNIPDTNQGIPDFITQTDANGNATTPRSAGAIQGARIQHPSGPKPRLHVDKTGHLREDEDGDRDSVIVDPCDTLLDSIRLMCCCLLPEDAGRGTKTSQTGDVQDAADASRVKLLGPLHPDDAGKKCLVLDLDETLVHSSFRAVPGADFVIPVQIEDVVHFVYVAKRPGVDEFLIEMAKHYEIVIYTASLNKYADPLLDLLDPNNVIRARLFRESCVYFEGNYVKDLSLLDRDLSQAIIVDNSPSSYIFHPENAIDCSSFIDDPSDRELDQIGAFLVGTKHVKDVRDVCHQWRDWPVINYKNPEDMR